MPDPEPTPGPGESHPDPSPSPAPAPDEVIGPSPEPAPEPAPEPSPGPIVIDATLEADRVYAGYYRHGAYLPDLPGYNPPLDLAGNPGNVPRVRQLLVGEHNITATSPNDGDWAEFETPDLGGISSYFPETQLSYFITALPNVGDLYVDHIADGLSDTGKNWIKITADSLLGGSNPVEMRYGDTLSWVMLEGDNPIPDLVERLYSAWNYYSPAIQEGQTSVLWYTGGYSTGNAIEVTGNFLADEDPNWPDGVFLNGPGTMTFKWSEPVTRTDYIYPVINYVDVSPLYSYGSGSVSIFLQGNLLDVHSWEGGEDATLFPSIDPFYNLTFDEIRITSDQAFELESIVITGVDTWFNYAVKDPLGNVANAEVYLQQGHPYYYEYIPQEVTTTIGPAVGSEVLNVEEGRIVNFTVSYTVANDGWLPTPPSVDLKLVAGVGANPNPALSAKPGLDVAFWNANDGLDSKETTKRAWFESGEHSLDVKVVVRGDVDDYELQEYFTVEVVAIGNTRDRFTLPSQGAVGSIAASPDEKPDRRFLSITDAPGDGRIVEGESGIFTLNLAGGTLTQDLQVNLEIQSGFRPQTDETEFFFQADPGRDVGFTPTGTRGITQTVTIRAGETSADVEVFARTDGNYFESTETFQVKIVGYGSVPDITITTDKSVGDGLITNVDPYAPPPEAAAPSMAMALFSADEPLDLSGLGAMDELPTASAAGEVPGEPAAAATGPATLAEELAVQLPQATGDQLLSGSDMLALPEQPGATPSAVPELPGAAAVESLSGLIETGSQSIPVAPAEILAPPSGTDVVPLPTDLPAPTLPEQEPPPPPPHDP